MEAWKVNLISVWLGCFFTGLAMSQILPFLPLYVEQLGVSDHQSLSLWSGLVFSGTFLVSAVVSPLWGSLADRKGRKLMLLRASLGMAIVIALQGLATNVWQLFALRALMGLTSGYIPNAMALVASQAPRDKSGWALGTLSTGQISGVIAGPLLGGLMADHLGLRVVFFVTAGLMFVSFLVTLFLIKERRITVKKADQLSGKAVFRSLPYPTLIVTLFVCTLMIQLANSSISPILTLFIRELSGDVSNIAFVSGMIAAVPGIAALISAPRLGRLGDRIGTARILIAALLFTTGLFAVMAWVNTPLQLGILRFLLGFADGALMPAVQALLLRYSSDQVTGRIFGYNQSFMYLGNVVGPLLGSGISAMMGFRWVFAVTAVLVLCNALQLRRQFKKVESQRAG
ncbi:multidrug efflux MFS transporter [Serratia sp. Lou2A]|jgi:DHA1 family multidrug resistance protein-like MFS transporter|uniref:DHA1 family multidrug resistance protein-like MFS transporter n=1 Tax=Serratia marcescens TaxID=615 RepID=A0AA46QAL9_SERMA|nr:MULTISPECIES: multidrug efflux MFS transporter [Serratia]MBH3170633.1 multidrug efflux MFS transporter [Serratia marcescens]MBH3200725.1 multidrug efflux MFS transporter [Serratia marcescens]MBL5821110.1 multidrug efflux MFS transporter [Serratia marcescens]MCA3994013.1 multidrug efflux MFS transporter [Serratia marcescens]MCC7584211.1 multidrug efflux MFS transporter [Serratia sp. Lou2A]